MKTTLSEHVTDSTNVWQARQARPQKSFCQYLSFQIKQQAAIFVFKQLAGNQVEMAVDRSEFRLLEVLGKDLFIIFCSLLLLLQAECDKNASKFE